MEKYGVLEEDPTTKTAADAAPVSCPSCEAKLRPPDKTGVLLCPNCGSKPFEQMSR